MQFMCAPGLTQIKEMQLYTESCSYLSIHGWDACFEKMMGREMKYPFEHKPQKRGGKALPQKSSLPPLTYFLCAAAHNLRPTLTYKSYPDYHRTDKVSVMKLFATTVSVPNTSYCYPRRSGICLAIRCLACQPFPRGR